MSQILFGIMLFLLLIGHASASGGPFAWLPLPLAGQPWQIGVLSLLPVLVVGGWWLENKYQQISQIEKIGKQSDKSAKSLIKNGPRWRGEDTGHSQSALSWGETAVTFPLTLFSLLILLRLTAETAHLAAMVGLVWFVYLFLVNHRQWQRDWQWRVLAAALLVQGAVAVSQFLLQREIGLAWLGEPTLDLLVEGTSVAQRGGQNWLRAYGLNSHPNQLGLLLMALCLLIWPYREQVRGGWRWLFWLGLAAGLAGLLVSLSRTAWAGLLLGGLVFAAHHRRTGPIVRRELAIPLAILVAGVLLFALAYGDVLAGRLLALDSPLESRSLWERQRDWSLAWQVWGERPFLGVGPGQYLTAASAINPEAALVHNVPLLVAAELGLVGLAAWLWFWLGPLWRYGRSAKNAGATAVWLALILFSLVHPEPSLTLPKGAILWSLAAAHWPSPVNPVTRSPFQSGSQL
ncbi:MAG: O-antigen ligase family protein [Anaerolineales bacterium]|nr:O-antigen ligase family protein [Anaerolineales bacterium]MCB8940130.1 O-antigen ligase family protein [Ardenticatenaceae bacterium]